jgi:2-polyprenyl-3-methyl-5-hydroxy-6-metoxy-1,4-benzoquinol methylase
MLCRICGANVINEFKVKEMMFGTYDEFVYVQCSNCGCLQIKDYLTNIDRYYPSDYYSFSAPRVKDLRLQGKIKIFMKRYRDSYAVFHSGLLGALLYSLFPNSGLEFLEEVSQLEINSRILDVGCGSGYLLTRLADLGFKHLSGIDLYIDQTITDSSKRIFIKKAELKDLPEDQTYDVIMLHHSLEHMPNQHDVFFEIGKRLTSAGVCIIRIPIINLAFEEFRENWVQIDAPRHYYLHTEESVSKLVKASGLKVVKVVYDSTEFQFVGSIKYQHGIALRDNYDFTKKELQTFKREAQKRNKNRKGDQACFYLRHAYE